MEAATVLTTTCATSSLCCQKQERETIVDVARWALDTHEEPDERVRLAGGLLGGVSVGEVDLPQRRASVPVGIAPPFVDAMLSPTARVCTWSSPTSQEPELRPSPRQGRLVVRGETPCGQSTAAPSTVAGCGRSRPAVLTLGRRRRPVRSRCPVGRAPAESLGQVPLDPLSRGRHDCALSRRHPAGRLRRRSRSPCPSLCRREPADAEHPRPARPRAGRHLDDSGRAL